MEAFDHFTGPASVGHLNGIFDRAGGNLNSNFQNSQMPGGLPGGDVEASIRPIHYILQRKRSVGYLRKTL